MKRVLLAFQFLTIIPIRNSMSINESDIAKSLAFFVVVGLIQGILLVITDYVSGMVFHPDLSIGIVILVLILSNGGFHLDGLADTFDAIAVKSEGNIETDRQKRLAIMKDGTTGPIGTISVVLVILMKYLALKNVSHFLTFTYYFSVLMMPVISKWAMVISMFHGRAARGNGLGRLFIKRIGFREVALSTLFFIFMLLSPAVFLSRYISNYQYVFYAVLICMIYFFCLLSVKFFDKKFGGLTGDTLGAISEITEIIFLLMVIIWSRLYI